MNQMLSVRGGYEGPSPETQAWVFGAWALKRELK